jgi:GT2 family glycosyltransferase
MYAEDLDLGWRLRQRGWKTVYEPAAEVLHADRAASRKAFGDHVVDRHWAESYAWMARSRGRLFARTVALLNAMGAAGRLAVFGPLARLRPERYGPERESARYWLKIHATAIATARRPRARPRPTP